MDQKILDKFGITEEWIEENAKQYEDGTFELSDDSSPIHYGKPALLKWNEAMASDPSFREAAEDVMAIGEAREQRRVIQMLEVNKVGLTPEQQDMLIKEIKLCKC